MTHFEFDVLGAGFPISYNLTAGPSLAGMTARFDTFSIDSGSSVLVHSVSYVIPEGDSEVTIVYDALDGYTYKGRITLAGFEPRDTLAAMAE